MPESRAAGCASLAKTTACLAVSASGARDNYATPAQRRARNAEPARRGFWQSEGVFILPAMPASTSTAPSARWAILLCDLRDFLVSLKLTIVLLGFSMVLVFAATLDQVNLGIWAVQEKYFRSFVVYAEAGRFALPIFPGGYLVGGLLLANLIGAHLFRFSLSWRKLGIQLTHLGLIVLLVGELLTGLWQKDFHLRLTEGETKNYAESFRHHELVVIDATDSAYDDVVAVPEALVARKTPVQHPKLPFRLTPKSYYSNSSLHMRPTGAEAIAGDQSPVATTGVGGHVVAAPQPVTHRSDERNVPSALVEVSGADGSLGTFLVSAHLPQPQTFSYGGRTWKIALRVQRAYQPFSLTLLKFSHDRYAGTDIPKNFSSRLRLASLDDRESREVLIYMNNPLRHSGLTFYQAGFENDDRTTVLQVVRNPSWLVPYIACALMTLGLVVQFGIHLFGFVRRRRPGAVSAAPAKSKIPSAQPAVPQTA